MKFSHLPGWAEAGPSPELIVRDRVCGAFSKNLHDLEVGAGEKTGN